MLPERNVGGRDRLARAVLAVVLAVAAVRAFRDGRRSAGLIAAVSALAFAFNATVCFCGLNRLLGVDTTDG
jgi:hypothetical protein